MRVSLFIILYMGSLYNLYLMYNYRQISLIIILITLIGLIGIIINEEQRIKEKDARQELLESVTKIGKKDN